MLNVVVKLSNQTNHIHLNHAFVVVISLKKTFGRRLKEPRGLGRASEEVGGATGTDPWNDLHS